MTRAPRRALQALALALLWPMWAVAQFVPPQSAAAVRDQEIAQCLPGEQKTWGDGRDRPASSRTLLFAYRHDGAPPWFSEAQVTALVRRAAEAWAGCGLTTRVIGVVRGQSAPDDAIQILWSETGSRGNAGLANVPARSLSLGPALFSLLRQRHPGYPADQTLQMTLSHEMGHFFGLMAHSRRCVDVMSYYDNGKGERCTLRDPKTWGSVVEYRSILPTACDLERCRAVNR